MNWNRLESVVVLQLSPDRGRGSVSQQNGPHVLLSKMAGTTADTTGGHESQSPELKALGGALPPGSPTRGPWMGFRTQTPLTVGTTCALGGGPGVAFPDSENMP